MKNTKYTSKFDKLFKEAIDDDNLFGDSEEEDEVVDDYESLDDEGEDGEGDEDVTITIKATDVEALRSILAVIDGEGDEEFGDEADEFGGDEFGGDEIEELEESAIESESAPDAEVVRSKSKVGKVPTKLGELDGAGKKEDEAKQYKFVKRVKPTERKTQTTGKVTA